MSIKLTLVSVSTSVALLFLLSGCPGRSLFECIDPRYAFRISGRFSPEKDSIKLGDTLYFSSAISKQLVDQATSKLIDYSQATSIGATLFVDRIINDTSRNSIEYGNKYFDFRPLIGQLYSDPELPTLDRTKTVYYAEQANEYILTFAVIPKDTGRYMLGVGNALSVGRKGSKSCEKASFAMTLSNSDQHLEIYLKARQITEAQLAQTNKNWSYCFKVY